MASVVAFDFPPGRGPVLKALPLHHSPLADLHRGADSDTRHVRHVPQNDTRSPAADQDVSPAGKIENFLGRVTRQALVADLETLEQGGAAFDAVIDDTIRHMQVLGEFMLDQFVEYQLQPHPIGDTLSDLPAAGAHFPRHRDDRHHVLPWFRRSARRCSLSVFRWPSIIAGSSAADAPDVSCAAPVSPAP